MGKALAAKYLCVRLLLKAEEQGEQMVATLLTEGKFLIQGEI